MNNQIELEEKIGKICGLPKAKRETKQHRKQRIGLLRQWLNEDRITDPNKMVTNEDLLVWLGDN